MPGLSPVLAFASLSVKQPLLALFDTFIVALDPLALRPALKAIVLALLPGLEEESSEEFERTHGILQGLRIAIGGGTSDKDELQDASGDQFFWQCMFLAAITSPSRRLGALAYLQRHLPHLTTPAASLEDPGGKIGEHGHQLSYDIEAVTQPEPGLLIRCFAAGLADDQLLVQRGFLDLLVTHLPFNSDVLQRRVTPEDLIRLSMAAVSVVLRREMSLNRRLWTWFLGPDEPSDNTRNAASSDGVAGHDHARRRQTRYFQQYGLNPLVQSIMDMLASEAATAGEKARPFRIALALMDRWEIGGLVVPNIFLPALNSVWRYQKDTHSPNESAEVLRSASVFFDGVESGLIWDEISNKLLHATEMQVLDAQALYESLELATFVVKNFNLQEEEMLSGHIPLLVLSLLLKAKALSSSSEEPRQAMNQGLVDRLLNFTGHLLDIIPGRAFNAPDPKLSGLPKYSDPALEVENQQFLTGMDKFYKDERENARSKTPPIEKQTITRLLLLNTVHLVMRGLRSGEAAETLEIELAILDKLFRKMPAGRLLEVAEMLAGIHEASEKLGAASGGTAQLKDVVLILSLLETMHVALLSTSWLNDHRLRQILPYLVTALWPHLSPASSKSNVEAIRCIWKVQQLSIDKKLVESCIAALMTTHSSEYGNTTLDVESARRFTTLWSHSNSTSKTHARRSSLVPKTSKADSRTSNTTDVHLLARPLLLLLDTLDDSKTELFTFTAGWLQSSTNVQAYDAFARLTILADMKSSIFAFLLKTLEASPCLRGAESNDARTADAQNFAYDVDDCLYYMRTLSNLVEYTAREVWTSLLDRTNGGEQRDEPAHTQGSSQARNAEHGRQSGAVTFQIRLTRLCLEVSSRDFGTRHKASPRISRIQQTAISLLQEVLLYSASIADVETDLETSIIDTLSWSTRKPDHPLQVVLMSLISMWLERRLSDRTPDVSYAHRRVFSGDRSSQVSSSVDKLSSQNPSVPPAAPPPMLLDRILEGLGATGSQPVLHHWISFLDFCLPFYTSNIFQILMPLVDRLIKTLESVFTDLQWTFEQRDKSNTAALEPISTIIEILNGIEQTLSVAHDRLLGEQATQSNAKTPEQTQGFFGNMVSGVLPSDTYNSRSTIANNRLTVILCFKDTVNLCLRVWSWDADGSEGSRRDLALSSSFNYTSLRLKNRARRILEHLFALESLECLETLIGSWLNVRGSTKAQLSSPVVLSLLHVLDGSRPRNTIPAIFNALYSRTNPAVLDPDRKSTLTSELSDIELARFLVEYTRSLEDDAMDEIWSDCMTFLKDVLANPLPHRQTLPKLLEFTALLGIKVDNTSFGENRKRRRELSVSPRPC